MSDTAPRELILASAGSGKTFRISSRIIGLLASGEPASSILASTFTRKAAGEIFDRVLQRLARAALHADAASALAEALDPALLPPDRAADPGFWGEVLDRTVRDLHRLDIGTLDAFLMRLVRGFANELGLVPGWSVADERAGELLRRDAVEQIFDRQDRGALVETIRAMQGDAVSASVHRALSERLDALLRIERSLSDDPEAPGWSAMARVAGPRPDDFPDRCRRLAERIASAPVPTSKSSGKPYASVANALPQVAEAIRARDWSSVVGKGPGAKVLEAADDEVPTYSRAPIEGELRDLLEEAIDLARIDVGAELAARGEALGRLADLCTRTWFDRIREAGVLRFEDLTMLPVEPVGEDGTPVAARPDLFYRMGRQARHLLLDEFQDTSLPQWRALLPVVDRIWAGDGAASVVADPKQSIYGWRGAAPDVVDAVAERYDLEPETMARSWRSSPVVLDAVNRVFDGIETTETLSDAPDAPAVMADWARAFTPHEAAFPDRPGRVRLLAGPELVGGRSKTSQPAFFRWVADHVRTLREELPERSIGVLLRKNDSVARMIFELGRIGVPASEEGGTRLVDSAPVVSLLALLRMADHPGDLLARHHVAETPVGVLEGIRYVNPRDDAGAVRVSRWVRRLLLEEGYGPTLAGWARELRPAMDAREAARTERLVELGWRHDRSLRGAGLRVGEFVKLAELERAESPGDAPVRVMTVHGSKGLEFDVVVLPELHAGGRGGGSTAPLAFRPEGAGPVTHVFPYVSTKDRPLFDHVPEFRGAVAQETARELRDSLGMLYVAMTRARCVLDLVIPADGEKRGSARDHARLVQERLAPDTTSGPIPGPELLWDSSDEAPWDPDALPTPDRTAEAGSPASAPPRPTLRTDGPRRRNLERRSPSSREGGSTVDVRFLLGLTDLAGTARDRGTLVHAWLERLEWVDDGLPDEETMLAVARRETPGVDDATVRGWMARLREQLEAPGIRDALDRRAARSEAEARHGSGATLRVEVEVPFLVRDGEALMEGFIDRLVLTEVEGRVVAAEILDWKTDALRADDPAGIDDRVEHYRPQIEAYRTAVAALHDLPPEDVRGRLLLLEPGVAREL